MTKQQLKDYGNILNIEINLIKKIIFLLISLLFITTSFAATEERLKPSNVNTKFDFDVTKTFEEYINYSRDIIKSGRVDLNEANKKQIIDWNSPFIIRPNMDNCPGGTKKGILLTHGLTDSPYMMRTSANYFSKKCFTVYSILLAGNGTRPGDLLEVSYEDWKKQINYGVEKLSEIVDDIYLGGFSVGGALSVNYVLSNPKKKIAGIFLLAPALNLPFEASFAQFVKSFKKYIKVFEDKNLVKYESFAMNGVAQAYALTQEIKRRLESNNQALKNTKVFAAVSFDEQTLDINKTFDSIIKATDANNRYIIVYHQNTLPEDVSNQKGVYPVSSYIEKDKILGLSHVSLTNTSQDVWYGAKGQYRSCLYYYNTDNYDVCKKSHNVYEGVITKDNLEKGILVRLAYNPFIDNLFKDLDKFFELSE